MTSFRSNASISGGTRDVSEALEGIRLAREAKALPGENRKVDERARDFMHASGIRDLLALWAGSIGQPSLSDLPLQRGIAAAIGLSADIRQGKRDIGAGVDTFTDILAAHADKALLKGWESADHTWRRVARVTDLQDFKPATRTGLSEMLLAKVEANGEITEQARNDRAEYIQGESFAATFNVSIEALTNDDLGVLVRLPYEAGIAASATVNQNFWNLVTTASGVGPTLNQDSLALFHATHANYTASGAAPAVAGLSVARAAMRAQADPVTARRVNIFPRYLVCSPELESTARVLAAADAIVGDAANLEVVVEAQLSTATSGTTAWYLFADADRFDTFDVGFVSGDRPYIESQKGWEVDGVRNKVRVYFGLAALDYRGVYRNKGA